MASYWQGDNLGFSRQAGSSGSNLSCFHPTVLRAGMESTRHNYLLLGLAVFQFPFNAWLARLPA